MKCFCGRLGALRRGYQLVLCDEHNRELTERLRTCDAQASEKKLAILKEYRTEATLVATGPFDWNSMSITDTPLKNKMRRWDGQSIEIWVKSVPNYFVAQNKKGGSEQ